MEASHSEVSTTQQRPHTATPDPERDPVRIVEPSRMQSGYRIHLAVLRTGTKSGFNEAPHSAPRRKGSVRHRVAIPALGPQGFVRGSQELSKLCLIRPEADLTQSSSDYLAMLDNTLGPTMKAEQWVQSPPAHPRCESKTGHPKGITTAFQSPLHASSLA